MRYMVYGLILIGLGFLLGGSVFLGDFSFWPILFDGAAIVFILWGVVTVIRQKQMKA
jgi:hypothetical protein